MNKNSTVTDRPMLAALAVGLLLAGACAADTESKLGADGEVCFFDEDCREPLVCDQNLCGPETNSTPEPDGIAEPEPLPEPIEFPDCPGVDKVPDEVLVLGSFDGSFQVGQVNQFCATLSASELGRLGRRQLAIYEEGCTNGEGADNPLIEIEGVREPCGRVQFDPILPGVYRVFFQCLRVGPGAMLFADGELGEYEFDCVP